MATPKEASEIEIGECVPKSQTKIGRPESRELPNPTAKMVHVVPPLKVQRQVQAQVMSESFFIHWQGRFVNITSMGSPVR